MESRSKEEAQIFKEKPDPLTNNVIEEITMACIDPGDVSNDQEKSTTFEHCSFLHKTYHNNNLREQVTVYCLHHWNIFSTHNFILCFQN